MTSKATRRQFLQTTAATSIGYWIAGGVQAQESKSPNERIAMAAVGIGGKGDSDSTDANRAGDMVAICEVDENRLNGIGNRYPKAKKYFDFRKMLDEMGDSIDAITVSTPDHTHAPASLMAMRMGIHCFCQKPMTHTIYEARLMGQVAREKGLATQMGNQGTSYRGLRKAAAMLKAGVLGTVKEVHVWTNRGTGALGDMACHTVNMPYMGLDLFDPISVQARTSGHNKDSYPTWSIIDFEFPANDWRPALKFTWYDGGKKVDRELLEGKSPAGSGCLVIGDKGKMYSPDDYAAKYEFMGDAEEMDVEFPQSPGHFKEWVRAIKGGEPAMSNFPDYASGLTETILLGNLAVWVADGDGQPCEGEKVEWDAKNLKCTNIEGLEEIVKPVYREGYVLDA
jgi:predicted dehydrogenase